MRIHKLIYVRKGVCTLVKSLNKMSSFRICSRKKTNFNPNVAFWNAWAESIKTGHNHDTWNLKISLIKTNRLNNKLRKNIG